MNPSVLAWALAQPAGSRALILAKAYTSGATVVMFEGRRTEYRSLAEIGTALSVLYTSQTDATQRRPPVTYASFSRGDGT